LALRLDTAETAFVQGNHKTALDTTQSLLRDLQSMGPRPRVVNGNSVARSLLEDYHRCVDGCVCRAGVILCMQALHELKQNKEIDDLVKMYYIQFSRTPCDVFVIWLQLQQANRQHPEICSKIVEYLEEDRSRLRLTNQQYEELVELLVLQGLLPLNQLAHAQRFVQNNVRLSPDCKRTILARLSAYPSNGSEAEKGAIWAESFTERGVSASPASSLVEKQPNSASTTDPAAAASPLTVAYPHNVLFVLARRFLPERVVNRMTQFWYVCVRYRVVITTLLAVWLLLRFRRLQALAGGLHLERFALYRYLRQMTTQLANLSSTTTFGRIFW